MKLTSCPRWGTAGHGRASAGRGSTAGHSPKPASKPGPSPAPAALPAPQGPAWLQCHPYPTPALVPSPRGDTQPTCSSSGHSAPCAALARAVLSPTTVGASGPPLSPSPPNGPLWCQTESVWGFVLFFVLFGSWSPDAGLQPVPALPGEGGPGGPLEVVAESRHLPHAHSLLGLTVCSIPGFGKALFSLGD